LRIGVAFSGSHDHPDDALRSIQAARLLPALARPGVELHVVQKDIRPADQAALAALPGVCRHDADLHDFADTAALLAVMDAVVSVDTSIAHLAGALGRPCLVLLQLAADFRWLRARQDSPWYPTLRLFRQTERADWSGPIAAVGDALEMLALRQRTQGGIASP
jgi:ADP-heptose:LPS heptosyltransferase